MRGASLTGSLSFAAFTGLASIPWMTVSSAFVGWQWAVGFYSLGAAVVYLVWIAPSWSRGFAAGGLAGVFAMAAAVFSPVPTVLVVTAAVIVAVARSGFLFAGKPLRALAVESVLVGGGLIFARALAGSSSLSFGLAFWGFFLLQSVFFLVGGITERPTDGPALDPFDEARRRALRLMEELP